MAPARSTSIARDAAVAVAQVILEEFFWPYSAAQTALVRERLESIVGAGVEAALLLQRHEILQTRPN